MTKRIRNNDLITRRFCARTLLLGGLSALALTISGAFSSVLAEEQDFDIDAGPAVTALKQFAQQANVSVVYSYDVVQRFKTNEVDGVYEPDEALRLMLAGTGLFLFEGEGGAFAVRIRKEGSISTLKPTRVADNGNDAPDTGSDNDEDDDDSEQLTTETDAGDTEVVFVTGSHIRGVGPVGSEVFTYDRKEIDELGFSTIPEFIQSLPQNFNGGASESTFQLSFENGANSNLSGGTGVNLRGLGNVSTLVLLNGQRLAPAGTNGGFVDISMIPLSAVERVEVLTDGASAIYGSDAIGGVVNFILRKDYDGAETRLRFGGAPEGGLGEVLIGQTFGKTWNGGYGMISYEYSHRDALDAKDRSFTKNAPQPNDLLPEQSRNSLFLTAGQKLSDDLEVFGTAYFNKRNSEQKQFLTLTSPPEIINSKTKQYGGTFGAALDLDNIIGNGWRAEVVGSYSHSEFIFKGRDIDEVESDSSIISRVSKSLSVDVNLDGALFSMPGGDAKLAIGGHFRRDDFGNLDVSGELGTPVLALGNEFSRNVTAVFGELLLPFVGSDNRMPGVERLEVSISGRYETYSDFGSSTNPKIGALWSPFKGLNFRGTWGTSFRAPLLTELDETMNAAILLHSPFFGGSDTVILLLGAGNRNIQPETATLWTAGFDFQPAAIPGLNLNLTYFNIDYKDRIATPAFNLLDLLGDPNSASLVSSPDADLFALIADWGTQNITVFPGLGPPADFGDAEFVFNGLIQNLAQNKITGLDFTVAYGFDTDTAGSWNFSLAGTYLFEFLKQSSSTDPSLDVVGTVENPVNLRMNGTVSWTYKALSTNVTVNYVDNYVDDRLTTPVPVGSWTTVNLYIAYDLGRTGHSGLLKNTVLALSVRNLFNQDPPFLDALRFNTNIFYDPNAASPVGRTLAFQITKQW